MIRTTRLALYRALRAVELFQSKDETRKHLQGIRFEHDRGQLTIVATDGHTMGVATLGTAPTSLGSFWLSALQVQDLLANLKCKPRDDEELSIVWRAGQDARFGFVTTYCLTEQAFPPWRQVTPERASAKDKADALRGLNPLYFARVGQAVERFCGGRAKVPPFRGCEVSTGSDLDPVRFDFTFPDTGDLCIILMPMML